MHDVAISLRTNVAFLQGGWQEVEIPREFFGRTGESLEGLISFEELDYSSLGLTKTPTLTELDSNTLFIICVFMHCVCVSSSFHSGLATGNVCIRFI